MYKAFISYSHAADNNLAPSLQTALENFAKPWYKLRQLNIFRDEGSLSANPHLWTNIQTALDQSEFLIYLASPQSANSKWVNMEVKHWVQTKGLEKLFIVLTEGEIVWDDVKKTYVQSDNNSLPEVLENAYAEEPFYIDLRDVKTSNDLSLQNPLFKKQVLKLAAPLNGMEPKDLASEEVEVHKKMMRIRNAAVGALVLLLIAALIAGWWANENRKEADRHAKMAEAKTREAQQNLKEFKIEEFERNKKNGDVYMDAEEYKLALGCYRHAQKTANDTLYNQGNSRSGKLYTYSKYLDSSITVCNAKGGLQ
jgi:hypothetical protein